MKLGLGHRGFGVIEILIATGIIVVAALSESYFFIHSTTMMVKSDGKTTCRHRAEAVLQEFKATDNKSNVTNWHPRTGFPNPTAPTTHLERFANGALPLVETGIVNWDKVNTWELINSGSNWALALYNDTVNYPNICTAGTAITFGGPNVIDQYYPAGPALTAETVNLQISRLDFSRGTVDCLNQGTQKIVPRGRNNLPNTAVGSARGGDVGLQLKTLVSGTDPSDNTALVTCTAQTALKPDADLASPIFVPAPADIKPNVAPCTLVNGSDCVGNANAGPAFMLYPPPFGSHVAVTVPISCNDTNVFAGLAVNEPATVFACDLTYSAVGVPVAGVNFQKCTAFSSGGGEGAGSVAGIHVANDNITGVKLKLSLANIGWFTVSIKSFDSAQNESLQTFSFRYQIAAGANECATLLPP